MTEAEWLASSTAEPMLIAHAGQIGPRRLRMFAIGCACQMWGEHISPEVVRTTLEFAECVAVGGVPAAELRNRQIKYNRTTLPGVAVVAVAIVNQTLSSDALAASLATCRTLVLGRGGRYREPDSIEPGHRQLGSVVAGEDLPRVIGDATSLTANLLRCVAGNPFRPVSFAPEWRTSTVLSLAQHIYDSRDFSPMPILADALQDAGCDHYDILTHCRDANATHVRGCWVVDIILGKS